MLGSFDIIKLITVIHNTSNINEKKFIIVSKDAENVLDTSVFDKIL